MPGAKKFPLVGGRIMRVTRLDGCGYVDTVTDPGRVQAVSEGHVSVEFSANVDEGDAIQVKNAGGKFVVNEQPAPQFTGFGVNVTFAQVEPDVYAMFTGQETVLDAQGVAVGFRASTAVRSDDSGVALEVWSRVPGVRCPTDPVTGERLPGAQSANGYTLVPFLQGGAIGDFTLENDAVSFVIQGAQTKDGNGWGVGPYDVTLGTDNGPSPLLKAMGPDDHLHVQITYLTPPEVTEDGAAPLAARTAVAGIPATFSPAGSVAPANAAGATEAGLKASPSTAWTTGQYAQGSTSGTAGQFYWTGTAWASGKAS